MTIYKIPTYSDLTNLYLDGMTKEEIIRMYKADAPQMDLRGRKRETKRKINHFFKIIDESKKTFIEQPKARSNRAALIFYASKKTFIPTTSFKRALEALENKGWILQEAIKDVELYDKYLEKKH
ncbi:MAG: hypothetical protein QG646_1197 [Euryarchaeota archaeon]|nr:hypothetical protein [Euryarchaeota archaeon]